MKLNFEEIDPTISLEHMLIQAALIAEIKNLEADQNTLNEPIMTLVRLYNIALAKRIGRHIPLSTPVNGAMAIIENFIIPKEDTENLSDFKELMNRLAVFAKATSNPMAGNAGQFARIMAAQQAQNQQAQQMAALSKAYGGLPQVMADPAIIKEMSINANWVEEMLVDEKDIQKALQQDKKQFQEDLKEAKKNRESAWEKMQGKISKLKDMRLPKKP